MSDLTAEIVHLVGRLVEEKPAVVFHEGAPRMHRAAPLLADLQHAVQPSGGHASAGPGSVSPGLPLDAGALDLLTSIESEVNAQYWLVCDAARRRWGWTLADRLGYWTGRVIDANDPAKLGECHKLLAGWVRRIEDLFDPPKVINLQGPCPSCGETKSTEVVDGETTVNSALAAVLRESSQATARAECRVCLTGWSGRDLHELAAALGAARPVTEEGMTAM